VQTRRLAASFDASTRSITRTGAEDIPVQSHVHLGVFFPEYPRKQPDAKELSFWQIITLWITMWNKIFF